MNGLNSFDKTDKEYSLSPTDDLFRFRRLKVKGEGHSRHKYVVAKTSTLTLGRRSLSSSLISSSSEYFDWNFFVLIHVNESSY